MMEEEGGGSSTTMVAADDAGGHGGHCPSCRRWRLEVILPSSALPPSCDDGGLRGKQKQVARCSNSVANAVAPARCTSAGATAYRARKTKVEAVTTTTTMTRTAWTMPVLAISRRQGGFNNQQGRESATEDGKRRLRARRPLPKPLLLAAHGHPPLPHPLDLLRRWWLEGRAEAHCASHKCRVKIMI